MTIEDLEIFLLIQKIIVLVVQLIEILHCWRSVLKLIYPKYNISIKEI